MRDVQASLSGSFLTQLKIGEHSLVGDEPEAAGGTDQGPTPYDFLGAALASCTVMTLQFYAKRESLPLESAHATVKNQRIHAKDCQECNSDQGFIHRFDVTLRLTGPLSTEQREKLLQVAQRCPVYKTLSSEIKIYETLESA